MSITLNGYVHRVVRDSNSERLVIVQRGKFWRVVDQATADKIHNGFLVSVLRMVP